jgi:dinuclear metal center YbgI/SA1388 family protein
MTHAAKIAEAIERIAPPALAEEWDNCGTQVGSLGREVERVLVALTPMAEVFGEAEEKGADFLLFHHPLIFNPLKRVDTSSYPGSLISRAITSNLTVYAAHTSYDAAPYGVPVALAQTLGLSGPLEVLSPRGALLKLVVFVPQEDVGTVADALNEVGAGVIGDYTHCTFRTPGTGTFLGGESTSPHVGEAGSLETADEIRMETVLPAHLRSEAEAALWNSHPYEEPALDLYPVEGYSEGCGFGRVGRLPRGLSPRELREYVSESLGFEARLMADGGERVDRVAVLGGSGAQFIPQAASAAQAYVTADVKYHDALLAESMGLTLIDAGHAATELPSLQPLAKRLAGMVDVAVEVSGVRR